MGAKKGILKFKMNKFVKSMDKQMILDLPAMGKWKALGRGGAPAEGALPKVWRQTQRPPCQASPQCFQEGSRSCDVMNVSAPRTNNESPFYDW
jgi:hypothetical protein